MRSTTTRIFDGVSANATQTSAAIPASQMFSVSVSVVRSAAGDNVGAVKLQASNEPPAQEATPADASFVDISGATVNTNGTTTVMIPKTDVCYQWLRLVYTKASGSGSTLTVDFHANGV